VYLTVVSPAASVRVKCYVYIKYDRLSRVTLTSSSRWYRNSVATTWQHELLYNKSTSHPPYVMSGIGHTGASKIYRRAIRHFWGALDRFVENQMSCGITPSLSWRPSILEVIHTTHDGATLFSYRSQTTLHHSFYMYESTSSRPIDACSILYSCTFVYQTIDVSPPICQRCQFFSPHTL